MDTIFEDFSKRLQNGEEWSKEDLMPMAETLTDHEVLELLSALDYKNDGFIWSVNPDNTRIRRNLVTALIQYLYLKDQ